MLRRLLLTLLFATTVFATTEDNYAPIEYNCDGATTEFTFGWPIESTSDVEVILKLTSTEAETVLTEDTHYEISATSNDYSSGGTVTTVATYANTYTLIIRRETPKSQNAILADTRVLRLAAIEDGLDKLTRLVQDIQEILGRCIKIPKTETSDVDLVSISNRADKNITFGAEGDVTVTSVLSTGSASISAYGETLIDDADAAEARGTLELDTTDDVEFADITADDVEFVNITADDLITRSPWIDVRSYGAVGNGVTDDYAAIQAAIDSLGVDGGIVYFPAGTYIINSGLSISEKNSVNLIGASTAAGILNTGTIIKWGGGGAGTMITIHASETCSIKEMIIDSDGVAGINLLLTAQAGLTSTWSNLFERVSFVGASTVANVKLGAASTTDIAFNTWRNCEFRAGKSLFISDSSAASNTLIDHCQFFGTANTEYGIKALRGSVQVRDLYFADIDIADSGIADMFVPDVVGAMNQYIGGHMIYSESTATLFKVENQAMSQHGYLASISNTSLAAGTALIDYDSPTPFVVIGAVSTGKITIGANVVSFVEINVAVASHTGTLTNKLATIIGNGVYFHSQLDVLSRVVIGVDGATCGDLTLWDGAGGNTPGYIKIASPDGTLRYLFVEDDGTVKVHNAVPTANADGDAIGDQTD